MRVFLGMILGALLLVAASISTIRRRPRPSPAARMRRAADHRQLGRRGADWRALKTRAHDDWGQTVVEVVEGVLPPPGLTYCLAAFRASAMA